MMKKPLLRIMCLALATICLMVIIPGCTAEPTTTQPSATTTGSSATTSETTAGLPLSEEKITLTAFHTTNFLENNAFLTEPWKKIEEVTNVHVEAEVVLMNQATEKFNLLITSNELPDLIIGGTYPGGEEKAITDGRYLDLNDYLQYAPNLKARMDSNEQIVREATTSAGYLPGYPILSDTVGSMPMGMLIRNDWLKAQNLAVPETIAEWDTVLRKFKEVYNCEVPLMALANIGIAPFTVEFSSAYGILAPAGMNDANLFYPENGNGPITYGAITSGFKDYLTLLNGWYSDGLYDQEFLTRNGFDQGSIINLIVNNQVGAVWGFDGWINTYKAASTDPAFEMVAAPLPSLEKGKNALAMTGKQYAGLYFNVSANCKTPEIAVRLLDYVASEEGSLLTNYGLEGADYTVVDGKPTYTQTLKDKLAGGAQIAALIPQYASLYQRSYSVSQLKTPEANTAAAVWRESTDQVSVIFANTAEENDEINLIMGDIKTYVSEAMVKAIMDPAELAKWDEAVAQIYKMNIERAIELKQIGYDRYNQK